jgi:hypothetical protein
MPVIADRHELLDLVHTMIEEHGFFIQYVLGDACTPSWGYTIGLLGHGHPEVVVYGLDDVSAHGALTALFDEIAEGVFRPVGRDHPQTLGDGPPVRLLPVPQSHWSCNADLLCTAVDYYRSMGWDPAQLAAVQLVWATPTGDFPWEPECSARFRRLQPILDPASRAQSERGLLP